MGYNDTEGSRYSDPPLTTIHQNFDYVGHWLLKNAVGLAQGSGCQSDQTPRLQMLVRNSCGGRDKITDTFRAQFQNIDITVEKGSPHHVHSDEKLSSVADATELQAAATA
jgi:hypothetical protein